MLLRELFDLRFPEVTYDVACADWRDWNRRSSVFNRLLDINTPEAHLAAAMMLVPEGLVLRQYSKSRYVPHACEIAVDWAHGGWVGESDHSFAHALIAAIARSIDDGQ